jgi:hypothetical protein
MIPKGIENVDAIIEAFNKTSASLSKKGNAEYKAWLKSAVEVLGQMRDKFFLKTNPAIPVTNKARKDAEELQAVAAGGDMSKFPAAFEVIKQDMDTLLKRASMDGVIIT